MRAFGPVLLAALCLVLGSAGGQGGQMVKPAPVSPPANQPDVKAQPGQAHAMTPDDIGAFFDGVIPLQLERSDIAGASVLVMQGDTVLLEKGYGFADQKKRQPVDPAHTIFRLASISKLFTWSSVMQLVEQGRLDLDTDVNKYLDFTIAPAFGKPITLRNLMTHTGGFEETDRDVILTDPKQAVTLRDYLIHNQPTRLFAPGTVPAYSNYGVGLGGYIVQRVSGEPFEQYVQEHIFAPLNMTGSSFYQPVQTGVTATPSEGYRGDTEKPPVGFEIFNPAPAGGLSSTAVDMGRFARALLGGGSLDGHQILKPETLERMWTPQFRASDQMPPIAMGFYQDWRDNTHWIGHEGDLIAFHSLFFLDPVTKTTLFISYNSAGGGRQPRPELIDMFTDRYFPAPHPQTFLAVPRNELEQIEGTYVTTRRADSNRSRVMSLFSQTTASIDKDGAVSFTDHKDLRGHKLKYKPIAKDLWEEVDGQRRIFAIRGADGHIVRLAGDFPGVQLERVAPWETAGLTLWVTGVSLLILLIVAVSPVYRIGRRMLERGRRGLYPKPGTVWLPGLTSFTALLWLLPFAALLALVTLEHGDLMPPTDAWDKWLILMNLVVAIALLLTITTVLSARRVVSDPHLRWITKFKFTLVALSCVVIGLVALHYHLIGTLRI